MQPAPTPASPGPPPAVPPDARHRLVCEFLLQQGPWLLSKVRQRVYLAGLKSPILPVTDAKTHEVVREIGPFSNFIRPFTVNSHQTLCYVNVNDLLGFEIGDLKSGRMLHRIEVNGFAKGTPKRHGCPSHGIGLTPDEKELWVMDSANQRVHIFDNTVRPPKQTALTEVPDA